jgi:Ser/Thr protein kinase RdoA (MazF antagonist)
MVHAAVLDLPDGDVRRILLGGYGIAAADIATVSGEIATVCRVRSGPRLLALKVMPADDPAAEALIRWQTEAMVALSRSGLPVPTTIADGAGRFLHPHRADGRLVLAHLTTWLTDPPLSDVPVDTPLLEDVGRTAARVHRGLDDLGPPPASSGHPWELTRTAETIRSVMGRIEDPLAVRLTASALAVFEDRLAPRLPELPRGVVHHDLHDSNLLVRIDRAGRRRVAGILDFGDMVRGPRLAELAVAAGYAARHAADPRTALLDAAAGWSQVCALTSAERACLLPAVVSRLAVNAAVWAARATGTRAAYARSRLGGTTATLERLLATDPDAFEAALARRLGPVRR